MISPKINTFVLKMFYAATFATKSYAESYNWYIEHSDTDVLAGTKIKNSKPNIGYNFLKVSIAGSVTFAKIQ